MRHYKGEDLKTKRYGQVFSGKLIGDLLVSMLPRNIAVKTVIDPMVGKGDLLQAAYAEYPESEVVLGIDIDKDVIGMCNNTIPEARILIKDAFKSEEVNITDGWDLVITNPPYVRYQTLKSNPEIGLPDGKELRESLIKHIQKSMLLDDRERQLYLEIAKKYSGLSDMAVPSWILCASIVKPGGYMVMVVPETWLNRDYALPIHYLLLRCFEIIVIARDVESSWFENAEVRTCLVVCKRKKIGSIGDCYSDTVLIELSSGLMNQDSLVGKLKYGESVGYKALNQIIYTRSTYSSEGISSRIVPAMEIFPGLIGGINKQKWIDKENLMKVSAAACLPNEIREIVSGGNEVKYDSLEDLGWNVGQGLRTGANDFFYARLLSEGMLSSVQTESWYDREILLDAENVRKALKKRADVKGLVVNYNDLERCVLYIQHQIRKVDLKRLSHAVLGDYTVMDPDLDDYITQGEKYISPSHKKPFMELSAVVTNEKKTSAGYERFWYMLPPLKERHMPNLCISRVCGEIPETMFVKQSPEKEIIVDANFVTLWNPDYHAQMTTFVLLNSTWAKLFLEVTCTAMGGGALKIEASHVRKIVFPRIENDEKKELEIIGKKILRNGIVDSKLQKQIDDIVTSLFGERNRTYINNQLEELLIKKTKERTGQRYDE